MSQLKLLLLSLTAFIFGGGGLYLYVRLGNEAAPPALLGAMIALTCLFYILSRRR